MSVQLFPVKIIGHIRTDFASKFGVPRQSGIVDALEARIEFEKEFARPDAFRGLEGFSHLWIIWQFSEAVRSNWSATVRPPRLGGNKRVGVFASRSPFRPNPIGLSSVKIRNRIPICKIMTMWINSVKRSAVGSNGVRSRINRQSRGCIYWQKLFVP